MVLGYLLNAGFKALKASAKTVFNDKSISENMSDEFSTDPAFGKLILKYEKQKIETLNAIKIMLKGNLPNVTIQNAYWGVKVYDITDDPKQLIPVVAILDYQQEEGSKIFNLKSPTFPIKPGLAILDWFPLGGFVTSLIQTPFSGRRKIKILVFLGNADNPVIFENGYASRNGGRWYWGQFLELEETNFEMKGYIETVDDAHKSIALAIELGMAVAMSDGNLDKSEGETIKSFMEKHLNVYTPGATKEKLKETFNAAFKKSFLLASTGDLNINNIINTINRIDLKSVKYDAMELCYQVMSSDGVADKSELKLLKSIEEGLNLEKEMLNAIKDKSVLELNPVFSETTDIETILGIDSSWSKEQINTHLKKEFKKWNSRFQNLTEGKERENAQLMLDYIAEARKKNE